MEAKRDTNYFASRIACPYNNGECKYIWTGLSRVCFSVTYYTGTDGNYSSSGSCIKWPRHMQRHSLRLILWPKAVHLSCLLPSYSNTDRRSPSRSALPKTYRICLVPLIGCFCFRLPTVDSHWRCLVLHLPSLFAVRLCIEWVEGFAIGLGPMMHEYL